MGREGVYSKLLSCCPKTFFLAHDTACGQLGLMVRAGVRLTNPVVQTISCLLCWSEIHAQKKKRSMTSTLLDSTVSAASFGSSRLDLFFHVSTGLIIALDAALLDG